MAFGWRESMDAYEKAYENEGQVRNDASLTHEMLAGGAAFYGFKKFEDRQRKAGAQVEHATAKELLAGIAGAEADRLIETKGADLYDREKARRDARQNAERMYDEHYGEQDNYDPNRAAPEKLQAIFGQGKW